MEVASATRTRRASLVVAAEYLRLNARRVALFQAMRMLRWADSGDDSTRRIQVRHVPHMHHPGADLESVEEIGNVVILNSNVLGLLGAGGPMPLRLVEEAVWQQRHSRRSPLSEFLSLLGERHLHWFYDAWAMGRAEEMSGAQGKHGFHRRAASSLVGAAKSNRTHFGLLAQMMNAPRSATALEALVAGVSGCPTKVRQFIGEWLQVAPEDRARLGERRLGVDCSIGSRIWQRICAFEINIAVKTFVQFRSLIPRRGALAMEVELLTAQFLRSGLRWRFQLSLPSEEAQPINLGIAGDLGQTAWLGRPNGATTAVRFSSATFARRTTPGVLA